MKRYHPLTPEEQSIILSKQTEYPASGLFHKFQQLGVYVCKQCDAPLYLSSSKLSNAVGCNWPSFEEEIKDSVLRIPDADGKRTEILCQRCQGHLGHVFTGERFTNTNTRHCVNSTSMQFISALDTHELPKAIFAGGCFWGVEHLMKQLLGVVSAISGYIGGQVESPSYEEVSSGLTGHIEAVLVTFDPEKTDYETLLKAFFEIHDPFQINGQGPDIGSQYASAIFYLTEHQRKIAHKIKAILESHKKIATKIYPASSFYPAEDYHQSYYKKTGKTPYCHKRVKRF